jgi:hypothetical protein
MDSLIKSLQDLGDAKHDDLSVAHDALSEIMRLRLVIALIREFKPLDAAWTDAGHYYVEGWNDCRDEFLSLIKRLSEDERLTTENPKLTNPEGE